MFHPKSLSAFGSPIVAIAILDDQSEFVATWLYRTNLTHRFLKDILRQTNLLISKLSTLDAGSHARWAQEPIICYLGYQIFLLNIPPKNHSIVALTSSHANISANSNAIAITTALITLRHAIHNQKLLNDRYPSDDAVIALYALLDEFADDGYVQGLTYNNFLYKNRIHETGQNNFHEPTVEEFRYDPQTTHLPNASYQHLPSRRKQILDKLLQSSVAFSRKFIPQSKSPSYFISKKNQLFVSQNETVFASHNATGMLIDAHIDGIISVKASKPSSNILHVAFNQEFKPSLFEPSHSLPQSISLQNLTLGPNTESCSTPGHENCLILKRITTDTYLLHYKTLRINKPPFKIFPTYKIIGAHTIKVECIFKSILPENQPCSDLRIILPAPFETMTMKVDNAWGAHNHVILDHRFNGLVWKLESFCGPFTKKLYVTLSTTRIEPLNPGWTSPEPARILFDLPNQCLSRFAVCSLLLEPPDNLTTLAPVRSRTRSGQYAFRLS